MSVLVSKKEIKQTGSYAINTKRFRAVLFDLDGTLVDTMPAFASLAAGIIQQYSGLNFEDAYSRYLMTSGVPFQCQLQQITPDHPEIFTMSDLFEKAKLQISARFPMSISTLSTLKRLESAGIGIAISSNNNDEYVRRFAMRSSIAFDFALGYNDELEKGGPHFDYAMRHYACGLRDLLFVGDSLSDAAIAKVYGLAFVAVTRTVSSDLFLTHYPQVACITDISLLPRLLDMRDS
jgi:phosphoglycolate phosphatase-like HAD superfamily hydrolase